MQTIYMNRDGEALDTCEWQVTGKNPETGANVEECVAIPKPDNFSEVYCVDAPYFDSTILQPTRTAMGLLYDGVFEYQCTGKADGYYKVLQELQSQAEAERAYSPNGHGYGSDVRGTIGSAALTGGVVAAGGAATVGVIGTLAAVGVAGASVPVAGWIAGAAALTAAAVVAFFSKQKKVSYSGTRIENGICVVTKKTTTKQFFGLKKNSSKEVVNVMPEHYMGKGVKMFDDRVSSLFKSEEDLKTEKK